MKSLYRSNGGMGFSFLRIYELNIPATLRAGDTISWTESNADYPASAGWTLAFALRAKDKSAITITASSSGANYSISIPSSTSKAYSPGIYWWQAYVYKGTPPDFTEKHSLDTGQIEILQDLTQAGTQTEFRSTAKQTLDAVEALLKGDRRDVSNYSFAGRSISKMTYTELLEVRSKLQIEYQRELDADAVAKGQDNPRRVGVRFVRP
jgi:hypothetical protein